MVNSPEAQARAALRDARLRGLRAQLRRVSSQLARLQQISERLSRWRLIVFAAGLALSSVALIARGDVAFWVITGAWVIGFAVLVRWHRAIHAAIARREVWLDIKRRHIARMTLDWAGLPCARIDPAPDAGHPFEIDLDITGEKSIHHLIDTAASRDGSRRLAGWLLETAPSRDATLRRQALARELTGQPLLRDRLSLNAGLAMREAGAAWRGDTLLSWLNTSQPAAPLAGRLVLLGALAAVNIALVILANLSILPPVWLATWLLYLALFFWQARNIKDAFSDALNMESALRQLLAVFGFLERHRYAKGSALEALCAPFRDRRHRPSAHLRRMSDVLIAAGVVRNPMLWFVVNATVPWDVFVAFRLARVKAALAQRLPAWLDVWFELEALSSLATFAYLNPHYAFPQIVVGGAFQATALGHPLVAHETRVCNDFSLPAVGELALITGSNMSGKSTFLRAIGVNLALAYAGGPVTATALETRPFRLFTSIRVTDSVTDGISYFYAEVKRLKALLDALRAPGLPLCFLIDEIFRGTNNRERLIGSRAYIRALAGGNGVGAIATHDLDLVRLADELPGIANYHFAEHLDGQRMVFDYRLRPGPCPSTNALRIMQLAGLPVDVDTPITQAT